MGMKHPEVADLTAQSAQEITSALDVFHDPADAKLKPICRLIELRGPKRLIRAEATKALTEVVRSSRSAGAAGTGQARTRCRRRGAVLVLGGMSSGGPYMGSSQMVPEPGGHSQSSWKKSFQRRCCIRP